jgi:hypothetical protein
MGKKKPKSFAFKGSKKAEEEWQSVRPLTRQVFLLVRQARYKKAYDLACEILKEHPKNRFAIYRYAVCLGDSEEWVGPAQHKRNSAKAAHLIRKILQSSRGIDPQILSGMRNEYYWFSKQPYKQYRLGMKGVRNGDPYANYSIGVGAVSCSLKAYLAGKPKVAMVWAKKAEQGWKNYFKVYPDYYNAYVWYAQSLGLQGNIKGMEHAMRKAAKLSGRPITYREFKSARRDVQRALDKAKLNPIPSARK